MKSILLCAGAALTLSGCAMLDGASGPTALPKNADVGIWSMKDQATVSQCLAQNNLSAAYHAEATDSKKTNYKTVVVLTSSAGSAYANEQVYRCV